MRTFSGGVCTSTVWLRQDQSLVVGRQSTADLCIDDPHLSRNHFRIEGFQSGFRITDLNSRNGTRLNGQDVSVSSISSGDRISAGGTLFMVELQEIQPEPPRPRVSPGHGSDESTIGMGVAIPDLGQFTAQLSAAEAAALMTGFLPAGGPESHASVNAVPPPRASVAVNAPPTPAPTSAAAPTTDQRAANAAAASPNAASPVNANAIPSTTDAGTTGAANSVGVPAGYAGEAQAAHSSSPAFLNTAQVPVSSPSKPLSPPPPEGLAGYGLVPAARLGEASTYDIADGVAGMIRLTEFLEGYYRTFVVVNRSQLNSSTAALLDYCVGRGEAVRLSETVFVPLADSGETSPSQFLRRAARCDAVVCVGTRFDNRGVEEILMPMVDLICYPSFLYQYLTKYSEERPRELFETASFYMLEKGRAGNGMIVLEPGFRLAGTVNGQAQPPGA